MGSDLRFLAEQERQKRNPVVEGHPAAEKAATLERLKAVIDKAQVSGRVLGSGLIVRLPSGAAIELSNASQAPAAAAFCGLR